MISVATNFTEWWNLQMHTALSVQKKIGKIMKRPIQVLLMHTLFFQKNLKKKKKSKLFHVIVKVMSAVF